MNDTLIGIGIFSIAFLSGSFALIRLILKAVKDISTVEGVKNGSRKK